MVETGGADVAGRPEASGCGCGEIGRDEVEGPVAIIGEVVVMIGDVVVIIGEVVVKMDEEIVVTGRRLGRSVAAEMGQSDRPVALLRHQ